ncbi:HAD family hydrolase [Defluviimonas sp. SAOS-178_SWC]|uniref:HAD family hydrolase n=1 Tax=Defluviimonas sp. SAOS-178_SWC TaxID=3121287 RepID=UPI003221D7AB
MTPAAVLFDCDGVLVDSEPITDRVIAANLARHGLTLPVHEIGTMFLGGTIAGLGEEARRMGATLPETWVDDIYAELFVVLAEGTPLIPGVPALLDALDGAGIPYAVGSNGPHAKMAVTLGQHPEIHARFVGRIFSRHDVDRPKPAPDLYLHAAKALGAAPESCVVVEDSPTGARAAQAAGMRCYGYAPSGDVARLTAVGARPFRHMDELPTLLGL